jgi:HAE1 family hydrophobic/amphiphilic exporter-1
VPLGELIQVRERNVLTSIRRENQQYERVIRYEFRGPRLLGDVIRDAAVDATLLPPGYSIRSSTLGRITLEDQRQLALVLLIAIGLIFVVTAALFESIRQPLVVLLAVPMALIGVFLTFFYVNATFTREAYVGVIMMGGIVVNNAILLVDHINRVRRERGELALDEAIVLGTLGRVRPILMTTATTVLGLLPMALGLGDGAELRTPMAIAVISGLLVSTLLTLYAIPVLYSLLEDLKARLLPAAAREDEVEGPAPEAVAG